RGGHDQSLGAKFGDRQSAPERRSRTQHQNERKLAELSRMARVLIVDDSPTETYKLTTMLEKHGHVVIAAETGEDGVSVAKKELPDVVLMDIVMPGLNGFQATRQ